MNSRHLGIRRLVLSVALQFALWSTVTNLLSQSWEDLRNQSELTPVSLCRVVADFAFEEKAQVQEPSRFLERQRGDCDDFARLASLILSERGYETKVVVVMMNQETHVVCYVVECNGYLDFNHRRRANPITTSGADLEDIADNVASDFRNRWHMASEIHFEQSRPVFLNTVFYYPRTSPPPESLPPTENTLGSLARTGQSISALAKSASGE